MFAAIAGGALIAVFLVTARTAAAQRGAGTVWDGVYSAAQAERGKALFETGCVRCHGGDLAGSSGPALKGDAFMTNWRGNDLNALFGKIRDTMPPGNPTGIPTEGKIDLVAYILQANGFPSGAGELPQNVDALVRGRALEAIQILGKGQQAAADVPDFSLVQVVGCLAQTADRVWALTDATAPLPAAETAPDPAAWGDKTARPSGQRFRLVSVSQFGPAAHSGRQVLVTGLISRAPDENRINVVSLNALGSACGN